MPHTIQRIETKDGVPESHIFTPNQGDGPWPAALFLMDGRGIRPALFEIGERRADAVYYVLLPDLFYRAGPYTAPGPRAFQEDPEFRKHWQAKFMGSLTPDNARADTEAYLDFLARQPEVSPKRVGTTLLPGRWTVAVSGRQSPRSRGRCGLVPRRQSRD